MLLRFIIGKIALLFDHLSEQAIFIVKKPISELVCFYLFSLSVL